MKNEDFPLVSILIPSHNRPQYLPTALESALNQSYQNIEIIISDTSTDDRVEESVQGYLDKHPNIQFYRNQVNDFTENYHKLFELSSGEFINYLHDDDYFHPDKITKMVHYFLSDPEIVLVTSHRQNVDDVGNYMEPITAAYHRISEDTQVYDGRALIDYALSNMINQIGEPSTALLRRRDLEEVGGKPGYYRGYQYTVVLDLALWVSLLAKGKGVYISDTLSYCRVHSHQLSHRINWLDVESEWLYLMMAAREEGLLASDELFNNALHTYRRMLMNRRLPIIPQDPKLNVELAFLNCYLNG